MNIKYFDAHAHIQFPEYDEDRAEVIARMKDAGVAAVVVGTDYRTSVAAVSLARAHDNLWASVGLHPTDVMSESFDEEKFSELALHEKVVAIGECGLDYYRHKKTNNQQPTTNNTKQKQKKVFKKHVEIAGANKKALMIHSRPSPGTMDAYEDILEILSSAKEKYGDDLRGNIHFFVGTEEIARQFFDLGFTISFTGVITFSDDYDKLVKGAPHENILSETDCPFVAPIPYRGKRNEPVQVREVVKRMIELRGADEKFCETLLRNAEHMFQIKLTSSD
ncbi:MAG: TatD family hydrolase [Patescibacteria group bacterium]